MTSSVVHLDMELNENVEVGHQAAPVGVDPGVEGDVPPCVDQEVEMLEIGKLKKEDALPVVSPDLELRRKTVKVSFFCL